MEKLEKLIGKKNIIKSTSDIVEYIKKNKTRAENLFNILVKSNYNNNYKYEILSFNDRMSFVRFLREKNNINHSSLLESYLLSYQIEQVVPYFLISDKLPIYFINVEIIRELSLVYQGKGKWENRENAKRYNRKLKQPFKKLGIGFYKNIFNKIGSINPSNKESIKLGIDTSSCSSMNGMKYTFGVEIETSTGEVHLSDILLNNLNMEVAHDGSISGGEYVTGVLQGDSGLVQLHNCIKLLKSSCKIDKHCGIHVHIGGADFNDAFSVYSQILGEKLQDDIFEMLPKSRRNNSYCQDMLKMNLEKDLIEYGGEYGVQIAYDKLFIAMSNGRKLGENYNKKKSHPDGRWAGRYNGLDHSKLFRYMWLNLLPHNFNLRHVKHPQNGYDQSGCTIEIRNHSGTLNFLKTKMWVLICMSITYFIENNKNDILKSKKLTIEQIVKSALGNKANSVLNYIKIRKKQFSINLEDDNNVDPELNSIKEICA